MSTPPLPSLVITRLGTTSLPSMFRLDVPGRATPVGQTVKNEGAVAPTAVTLSTAATAFVGTPCAPATASVTLDVAPMGAPAPRRVSSRRTGTMLTRSESPGPPLGKLNGPVG